MPASQGSLPWRPAPTVPQPTFGRQAQARALAPCPQTVGHRLIRWAMSALGIRKALVKTATIAASVEPAVATVEPPSSATTANGSGQLRLAIVGDVHGAWRDEREEAALRFLNPDLTLLVGDFGNGDVELVRRVAQMGLPKAVILGNHDAWFTVTRRSGSQVHRGAVQQTLSAADMLAALSPEGAAAASAWIAPPTSSVEPQDYIRQQLAALGSSHVGYGTMQLDEHGYTVMGARPFSKGGKRDSGIQSFIGDLYGVTDMEESAARILQVAKSAPADHALVVMGHNGPSGLGSQAFDICGIDWDRKGGDHGDPDLAIALAALHRAGRRVALVTFGHMHHTLHAANNRGRESRLRRMVALDATTGTVFLNAATVPRVRSVPARTDTVAAAAAASTPSSHKLSAPGVSSTSPKHYGSGKRARMAAKAAAAAAAGATTAVVATGGVHGSCGPSTQHHFMIADLDRGEVVSARDVWIQVTPVTEATATAVLHAATAAAAAAAAGSAGNDDDSGEQPKNIEETGACEVGATAAASMVTKPRRIGDFVVHLVRDHVVLRTVPGADGCVVKFIWNAHDQVYEPYILNNAQAVATPAEPGREVNGEDNDAPVTAGMAVLPALDDSEVNMASPELAAVKRASELAAAAVVSGLGR